MACCHFKLMKTASLPPLSGEKFLLVNRPLPLAAKSRALPPQITREQKQNVQALKAISISRRDAMLYVTAQILSGVTFLSADPAEARSKLENKKKVLEKLEKLREEAGVSKLNAEKKPQSMNPQESRPVGPVMEAILP